MPGRPVTLYGPIWHGLDTVEPLTAEHCKTLVSEGVSWVARYTRPDGVVLERPNASGGDWAGCWSLSVEESRTILDSGLMLLPLQFAAWSKYGVTQESGHRLGSALRRCARLLSIPPGVHLWPDYEGGTVQRAGARSGKVALEALAAEATRDGHHCGLYHSVPHPLTGSMLWGLRGVTAYWAAANQVPAPLPRENTIRQRLLRAGYRNHEHPRWCGELGRDCPVPCGTDDLKARCPLRPDLWCLIPRGIPGHDPDVLRPDCLGEMPSLWAA